MFRQSFSTNDDGTRVYVIESSHPYSNDEHCVQVVGDENCSKIKFQITEFAIEDEDPGDDYRHGDGISHCEFDAFQISWKDNGFYNTTGRLCEKITELDNPPPRQGRVSDYEGNDPDELGFYRRWNTIHGNWFAIYFSTDAATVLHGFKVEWMCAMKVEEDALPEDAVDESVRSEEELGMYECDKEGYEVLDTENHHMGELNGTPVYNGLYNFDSPGLYFMTKESGRWTYRMELLYDSEELAWVIRGARAVPRFGGFDYPPEEWRTRFVLESDQACPSNGNWFFVDNFRYRHDATLRVIPQQKISEFERSNLPDMDSQNTTAVNDVETTALPLFDYTIQTNEDNSTTGIEDRRLTTGSVASLEVTTKADLEEVGTPNSRANSTTAKSLTTTTAAPTAEPKSATTTQMTTHTTTTTTTTTTTPTRTTTTTTTTTRRRRTTPRQATRRHLRTRTTTIPRTTTKRSVTTSLDNISATEEIGSNGVSIWIVLGIILACCIVVILVFDICKKC
ncbi:Oidioi.mRNA.OKI2018_I69.PAR.g10681.t1.cds [Oikopleura dioica]|uniref:Oidioi.mRNA.OKI2018_I69.PAR.g10681.t1.cds n=1 Tax=Oikopleura dioica TaxID=34765 RepID=A0ABN7RW44_OIKDI|nr:Oidioi.mRNA.OKI2018_I69.PAR.g10681.t1.cds [Oikopleura dioica]